MQQGMAPRPPIHVPKELTECISMRTDKMSDEHTHTTIPSMLVGLTFASKCLSIAWL